MRPVWASRPTISARRRHRAGAAAKVRWRRPNASGERSLTEETSVGNHDEGRVPGHPRPAEAERGEAVAAAGFVALHEIVKAARAKLSRHVWDYLIGGTGTETTVLRNRLALDTLALRARVLNDVSEIDATATFFGRAARLPVLLAPIGGLESFHPGGGITVARGGADFGVPIMLSSASQPGLEPVAAASNGCKVYQLYVRGDAAFVDERVKRAVAAGYDVFCVTVDSARYSRRERDLVNRYVKPWLARPAA